MVEQKRKDLIVKRLNQFVDGEGYRKDYLADLLGENPQTIYQQLSGKSQNIEQFAVDLARTLNRRDTFFIEESFPYLPETDEQPMMHSLGTISEEGKKELDLVFSVCELIDIYDRKRDEEQLER